MPPRKIIYSCGSEASRDNAPSSTACGLDIVEIT